MPCSSASVRALAEESDGEVASIIEFVRRKKKSRLIQYILWGVHGCAYSHIIVTITCRLLGTQMQTMASSDTRDGRLRDSVHVICFPGALRT